MARLMLIYEPTPPYLVISDDALQSTGKRVATVDLQDSGPGQAVLASRMLAHLMMGLLPQVTATATSPGDVNSVTIDGVLFADAPVIPELGQMIISRDLPYRWAKWTGHAWELEAPYDQARPA
jgi:hypothetical protein